MRTRVGKGIFVDRVDNLLGGINNSLPDEYISNDELSDARNYVPALTSDGVITKRDGISAVSPVLSGKVTSIFDGIHSIWATLSTKVIDVSGTDQVVLSPSISPDWTRFNGQGFDIVCNGFEVKKYNGLVWSDLGGSPPAGKYIESYNNMVFLGGHDRGKLRWSDLGDSEVWQAVHERNFNYEIKGIVSFRDVLVVFTSERLFHLRGFGPKELTVSYSTVTDCTSHMSIVSCEHGLFWWSSNGLCWSPDGFQVFVISDMKIPKTIDSLDKNKYNLVHGVFNSREQRLEYYVPSQGATDPNLGIFYYPRIGVKNIQGIPVGSFWLQSGAGAEMSSSAVVTVLGAKRVYLGGADRIYNQSGTLDDGGSISAWMETRRYSAQTGEFGAKRARRLSPQIFQNSDGIIEYGIYLDNDDSVRKSWIFQVIGASGFLLGTSVLDVDILGLSGTQTNFNIGFSQKFRKIKHRISDATEGKNGVLGIELTGYVLNV